MFDVRGLAEPTRRYAVARRLEQALEADRLSDDPIVRDDVEYLVGLLKQDGKKKA